MPQTPHSLTKRLERQGKDVTEEVIHLIKKHGEATLVATELGASESAIHHHLKKGGFVKRWVQIPDSEIVDKYAELRDERAVAGHFNIAQSYVHETLLRKLVEGTDG